MPPITDVAVALDRMLQRLTDRRKRVLVTVDEAVSNERVREFASQFQIYLRKNYNLFLLMTGLYENIYELQNVKSLTFLYRAPKVELKPLNIGLIADSYKTIFGLDDTEALQMAKATAGYSFAYQALGYLCFSTGKPWQDLLPQYDALLEEYVYEKIWSESSARDKLVMKGIASTASDEVRDIRATLGLASNEFTVYRSRLIRKGVVTAPEYGHVAFTLPRFREFVFRQ